MPPRRWVAIRGDRRPLDVAGVGDGDRHVFVGDQILDAELAALARRSRCAARRRTSRGPRVSSSTTTCHQQLVARQDRAQPLDRLHQLGELVEDLLPLQAGQPLELHVEDRLRLELRQAELRHQPFARLGRIPRAANERDHLVEMIERDPQPFEDVRARFGLAQLELGPAPHHLAAELDELLDDVDERQHLAAGRRRSPA